MYRALYRKYRPQGFDSLVGQNTIIKTLKNSIKNNSFSHAYMFFGPRGVGKTTASKLFARSINCLDSRDGNACGKCSNCLHSYEKECVDIIEIDAASNNGVDEMRELKNKISLVPAELKYKVYIIDEVHMLSIGAFNALLKTLEEPPEHAIFILATTDPQKVPETIISRCQCFSFKRISDDVIVKRLREVCSEEGIDIDDDVLHEIALASDGGMRDALGALDKLSSYSKERITIEDFAELNGSVTTNVLKEFCDHLFAGDVPFVLISLNKFSGDGKNLIQIISQLMHFLRNLIVDYYISNSEVSYSIEQMQVLVNIINEKMFDIKKSGNPKVFIEMLLIKYINDTAVEQNISREIKNGVLVTANDLMGNNSKSDVLSSCSISQNINTSVNVPILDTLNRNGLNCDDVSEDDEYDFDKEFSDVDDYGEEFDGHVNILHADCTKNSSYVDDNIAVPKNIDDIIKIRVNNTLAEANKNILKDEIEKMKQLNDYTFDQEIGYIVCSLLDAKVRAASENNVILSYEYDSSVRQNINEIDKIICVYNKITNSNKKLAIISDDDWELEKNKYIKSIKDGICYKVLEEPAEIFEEITNNDIISNNAVELFGDIVEIE